MKGSHVKKTKANNNEEEHYFKKIFHQVNRMCR